MHFKTLLSEVVRLLKNDLGWATSLSVKQRFCWGILATCCSKIAISSENFDWAHYYSTIIGQLNLGLVYYTYCTGNKLAPEQRIIASKLPEKIERHPSPDVRR